MIGGIVKAGSSSSVDLVKQLVPDLRGRDGDGEPGLFENFTRLPGRYLYAALSRIFFMLILR